MKHPKYPVELTEDDNRFIFYSEGPRGRIQKGIQYERINGCMFNLSFGDWNDERQHIDDSILSNNGDRDKILATVACNAIDFTRDLANAQIFFQGSTPARTRLYQMGIRANLLEIREYFEVMGWQNDQWERFRPLRKYESFLAIKN